MASGVEAVVDNFHRIVAADGGSLVLLAREGGAVSIRYNPGVNEDCADCVLDPADLRELVLEAIQRQDPSVTALDVVVEGDV
ncbi:MAG: hypothetical protein AB7L13_09665 [Acidimicrobiia bacterium]